MKHHCCTKMDEMVTFSCDQHPDRFDCPDCLVSYSPTFDEYGLIIHDGGLSIISIQFCPWCGARLPASKRDRWFEALAELGFNDPTEQEIPQHFKTDAWYLEY
jgi:hypothetical protein